MFANATHAVGKMVAAVTPEDKNILKGVLGIIVTFVVGYFILKWVGITTEYDMRIFGIPVEVSLLTGIMWIIFTHDAFMYIRRHHIGLPGHSYFLAGMLIAWLMGFSVITHEFAHALTALALGYPIDHAGISWWGAFVGWTDGEMTPINQILISLAGPFSNILIALVASLFVMLLGESLFENTIQYLCVANLRLGMLNLIPFLVLDGGHAVDGVLRLFISNDNIRLTVGIVIFIIFLIRRQPFANSLKRLEEALAIA